eukprot:1145413-Pelagomonas_calceolata.AAC.5
MPHSTPAGHRKIETWVKSPTLSKRARGCKGSFQAPGRRFLRIDGKSATRLRDKSEKSGRSRAHGSLYMGQSA